MKGARSRQVQRTGGFQGAGWSGYLDRFHRERAGITETMLGRCIHGDDVGTPYDWLLSHTPTEGALLDLACGSAPIYARRRERSYLGIDRSIEELRGASANGARPLVRGDIARLPFRRGCLDTVVSSMALMLVEPLGDTLAEIAGVLRPGGTLVAIVPTSRPLTLADRVRLGGLFLVLGRGLHYPAEEELRSLGRLAHTAGLTLIEDESLRFVFPMEADADASLLLDALYLRDLTALRRALALVITRRWVRRRLGVPVPIRFLRLQKPAP